jgi:hypothetical protein
MGTTLHSGVNVLHEIFWNVFSISSTYEKVGNIIFGGTDQWGYVTKIRAAAYKESAATDYAIRIYDVTNSLTIAEATGLTNNSTEIIDLGVISNLPTDAALWEVQVKRTASGNRKMFLDALSVSFGDT